MFKKVLRTILTVILSIIVIIIGFIVYDYIIMGPRTVDVRVEITGKEGIQVTGQYTADGADHTFEETLPATINIDCKRLLMTIHSLDESEDIFVQAFVDNQLCVGGGSKYVQINVTGKTMTSSPRGHLKASGNPLPK